MRGAIAVALLAAFIVALPAQALAPPPDPEQTVADAIASLPQAPQPPGSDEIFALASAATPDVEAEATAAAAFALATATDGAAQAVALAEGTIVPAFENTDETAAAALDAAVAPTSAGCWLDEGFACAPWFFYYYPGLVYAALDVEHGAEDAAVAMFDATFAEYERFPDSSPTPGVIVGPGLVWVEGAWAAAPGDAFAWAQGTLEVIDEVIGS